MSLGSRPPTGPSATPPGGRAAGEESSGSSPARGGIEKSVDDRPSTLREGWRLYGQGQLENARRLIMPEAARWPDDPEPAYLLGMIFKAQGQANNAIKAFAAVKRSLDAVGDRTRADMLRRLAQANLDLLDPSFEERRVKRQ